MFYYFGADLRYDQDNFDYLIFNFASDLLMVYSKAPISFKNIYP